MTDWLDDIEDFKPNFFWDAPLGERLLVEFYFDTLKADTCEIKGKTYDCMFCDDLSMDSDLKDGYDQDGPTEVPFWVCRQISTFIKANWSTKERKKNPLIRFYYTHLKDGQNNKGLIENA